MDLGLKGKVVLIIGGLSGHGRAVAVAAGLEGAYVVLAYNRKIDAMEAASLVSRSGGQALTVHCDLADFDSVQAAIKTIVGQYGTIHVLIHTVTEWENRKGFLQAPVCGVLPPEPCGAMVLTAVHRAYRTALAVIPAMHAQGWGRIVFLSANEAESGKPGSGGCPTAQVGLHGLATHLAQDWGSAGILTNAILVGPTLTERAEATLPEAIRGHLQASTSAHRLADPKELTDLVAFLGSAANGSTTGQIVTFNGSSSAHSDLAKGCWASIPVMTAICQNHSQSQASPISDQPALTTGNPEIKKQVYIAQRLVEYGQSPPASVAGTTSGIAEPSLSTPVQTIQPNRRSYYRLPMHHHPCTLRLVEVNGKKVTLRAGEVALLDLSGGGCQVTTTLDLPVHIKIICEIFIELRGAEFRFLGELLRKQSARWRFNYGIKFIQTSEAQQDLLVRALNLMALEQQRRSNRQLPPDNDWDSMI